MPLIFTWWACNITQPIGWFRHVDVCDMFISQVVILGPEPVCSVAFCGSKLVDVFSWEWWSVLFDVVYIKSYSYIKSAQHFPFVAKRHGLATLLLLCGDISLNPGPISFGVVNCRSVRNKGPCINDTVTVHSVDILAVTETHIRQDETDSLLHYIHPIRFQFLSETLYLWPWWWHWIFHQ